MSGRASDGMSRGSETILVVDDEVVCVELIEAMLTRYGYRVVTAWGGAEALRQFNANPETSIDLAIIDIVMHDMTGLEVARELQQLRPGLPILFISSFSQNPALRPPEIAHIPFLAKPFSSITLTAKIREMLAPKTLSAP